MNRYPGIILAIVIALLAVLAISPIISLFLPLKLTDRTYHRLLYHCIVEKETAGCLSEEEKALRLLQYVAEHEFAQGTPYKCKPAESLIYAEAFCDFQARTFNALLSIAGIKSRYAMLLDKDGISPHTVNEVFLKGKWAVFDPLFNIVFRDEKGNFLSLDDLSQRPALVSNQRKLLALSKSDKASYISIVSLYARVLPLPHEPRRSTPFIFQSHLFDKITDVYFRLFKYSFFSPYQDLYLKFKKDYAGKKDFKLFFMARNYHLAYRYSLALKYYKMLLENYPQSPYKQDAFFFCGVLFFQIKDFSQAEGLLQRALDTKWKGAAGRYLVRMDNLRHKN